MIVISMHGILLATEDVCYSTAIGRALLKLSQTLQELLVTLQRPRSLEWTVTSRFLLVPQPPAHERQHGCSLDRPHPPLRTHAAHGIHSSSYVAGIEHHPQCCAKGFGW